jgi:hypothetical protein
MGNHVLHRREVGLRARADALRRRIERGQLRMRLLQFLQLAKQPSNSASLISGAS